MKIEITSYKQGLSDKIRLKLTREIINNSTADLLLFSGHTIGFVNDIEALKTQIENKQIEVVLELEDINTDKISNCLYRITNGRLISLYTNQIFSQSSQIEGNYELAARLLHEFETNRIIKIKETSILIIQCGEINILKNIQSEDNRVEFRLSDDKSLKNRFKKTLKETKIIFNPIHTPMGNQGKMQKRREFLSNDKRYYFSTCNTKEDSNNLELKSLQYALYNGESLSEIDTMMTEYSISRIYEIK
jgi:hypothetical protein